MFFALFGALSLVVAGCGHDHKMMEGDMMDDTMMEDGDMMDGMEAEVNEAEMAEEAAQAEQAAAESEDALEELDAIEALEQELESDFFSVLFGVQVAFAAEVSSLEELRELANELRAQVDAGEITGEEAYAEFLEASEELRADREEEVAERIAEVEANDPERAEKIRARYEENREKRESRHERRGFSSKRGDSSGALPPPRGGGGGGGEGAGKAREAMQDALAERGVDSPADLSEEDRAEMIEELKANRPEDAGEGKKPGKDMMGEMGKMKDSGDMPEGMKDALEAYGADSPKDLTEEQREELKAEMEANRPEGAPEGGKRPKMMDDESVVDLIPEDRMNPPVGIPGGAEGGQPPALVIEALESRGASNPGELSEEDREAFMEEMMNNRPEGAPSGFPGGGGRPPFLAE